MEAINREAIKKLSEKKWPIAEIFTSWQGEGLWAGTRMTFIRFAGCNVGKPFQNEHVTDWDKSKKVTDKGIIPIWQEQCTTYDGRKFACDTDYRVKERLTAKEILERVPIGVIHLCFTGGEPLLYWEAINYIRYLWIEKIEWLPSQGKVFHIETSGTIDPIISEFQKESNWLTISPKVNFKPEMIQAADEIKFLVDKDFKEEEAVKIASMATSGKTIVWLSPINGIDNLSSENSDKCKEILERYPNWRMATQNQKVWCVK